MAVSESSVRVWKAKYFNILLRRQEAGETSDITVKQLPAKKRGRPLLLGEKQDGEVKSYIRALRVGGGVVTISMHGSCNSYCEET